VTGDAQLHKKSEWAVNTVKIGLRLKATLTELSFGGFNYSIFLPKVKIASFSDTQAASELMECERDFK